MIYAEFEEQKQLIKWWYDLKALKLIPNSYHLISTDTAAKRTIKQQGRYKDMGGRSGVLDLFLAVPLESERYQLGGLWIEMKAPNRKPKKEQSKGGLTEEQIQMIKWMKDCGYKTAVCYSAKEAQKVICDYLSFLNLPDF